MSRIRIAGNGAAAAAFRIPRVASRDHNLQFLVLPSGLTRRGEKIVFFAGPANARTE